MQLQTDSVRRPVRRLATLAAVAVAAGLTAAASAADLVVNLVPGGPTTQRITVTQSSTQSMNGMEMSTASTTIYDLTHTVLEKPAKTGDFSVRSVIDRVRIEMTVPMSPPVSIDSKDQASTRNPMAAAYGPILAVVGKPLDYEVTRDGKIVAADSLGRLQIAGGAAAGGSDMATVFRELLMPVPGKSVSPGDAWERTVPKEETGLPVPITMSLSLKSLKDGAAVVAEMTTLNLKDIEVPAGPGMTGSLTLTGTAKGTSTFDASSGWIRSSDKTQEMSGAISIPMGPERMTVPLTIKMTTKVETVKPGA